MTENSPIGGDKLKKAVLYFSEVLESFPDKNRNELLREIQFKFDLSPADCEFLDRHLAKES